MIVVLDKPATPKQIKLILEEFDSYIKIVIDIEKERLVGGGKLHVDCEEALLKLGSRQENLWGGGVDWERKGIDYNSLTNIRPREGNPSQEILDIKIREKFARIVKKLLRLEVKEGK